MQLPYPFLLRALACAAALAAAGCAQNILSTPTAALAPYAGATPVQLPSAVEVRLPTRYTRTLAAGSRWLPAGTLPQGTVYRPVDSVFTIEGRNVHEAYLVIRRETLTGFYLPAESQFAPLSDPIQLPQGVFKQ